MFDDLKFDRETFPTTGYLAHLLLTTQAGIRWCLDFFYWVREEVESGNMDEEVAFSKFKEVLTRTPSHSPINPQKVDWVALFNFIEEKTRPDDNNTFMPKIILRAPSDKPEMGCAQTDVIVENLFQSDEDVKMEQNGENKATFRDTSTPRPKKRRANIREDVMLVFGWIIIALYLGALALSFLPDIFKAIFSNIGEIAEFIIFSLIILGAFAFLSTAIEAAFGSKPRNGKSFYSKRYPENWDTIRATVLKRDGYRCGNCGSTRDLHVHHIVPLSKGGTNNTSNLRTLCLNCHKKLHPHMR